jgi:hypothetical protein
MSGLRNIPEDVTKKVTEMMNKHRVPAELFRAMSHIYWLHEVEVAEIEDAVKFIWAFSEIHNNKLNKESFNRMITRIEQGCLHPMEKMQPESITKEEWDLRYKAIELLVNLVAQVYYTADGYIYVFKIEDIPARIEEYKNSDKYRDMFSYNTEGDIFFKKYLKQYLAGIPEDQIQVDENEVSKEYQQNLNKIRAKDKRVKFRDIEMIDTDTKEIVHTFSNREECIEQTGISKSHLSQIIASTKVQHSSANKYDGWKKWKDKNNGKYYYFREKYKE